MPIRNILSLYRPDRSIIDSLDGSGLKFTSRIRGEYDIKLLQYKTSIVENMRTAKTSLLGKNIGELLDPVTYKIDRAGMTYNSKYLSSTEAIPEYSGSLLDYLNIDLSGQPWLQQRVLYDLELHE